MFEARMPSADILKKVVDAMKDLVNETSIDISADGLSMQAMDSSHVSLCCLVLKRQGFEHYQCDKNVSIGLNLSNLAKILKCANSGDSATLKYEEGADVISLQFEDEKSSRVAEFEMNLMDIEQEHLGIPDAQYQCQVKMPSSEFQRIVRDLAQLGDSCTIKTQKDQVTFVVSGEVGTGNLSLNAGTGAMDDDEKKATSIELEEAVSLQFAMRYLVNFTKATPLSDKVSLSLSSELPVVVAYEFDGGELGSIRYFLAPKLNSEEDDNGEE